MWGGRETKPAILEKEVRKTHLLQNSLLYNIYLKLAMKGMGVEGGGVGEGVDPLGSYPKSVPVKIIKFLIFHFII